MHRSGPKSGQKGGRMASFDHAKLKGLCREKGETIETISKALGITRPTMSRKWNGKSSFTDVEIFALMAHLGIDNPVPYLFTPKV